MLVYGLLNIYQCALFNGTYCERSIKGIPSGEENHRRKGGNNHENP